MIGEKIYIFLDTLGLVEYTIKSEDKKQPTTSYHVFSSKGKRRVISCTDITENYSPTPEEAKAKWYKNKSAAINQNIDRLNKELNTAKKMVDYNSLKQEHPDLLV